MAYSPFGGKPLSELVAEDLASLVDNGIAEGMTVEFKRQPVENRKLSHSIASFANTIGGWYIIGVETDADSVASTVPGCDLKGRDYLSTIRDVAISCIDPVPLFEARTLPLAGGRSVVVVHVPNNQETPFVTSDGRIYRRAADSSTPIAEADRHSVDRLVDKGRDQNKRLTRFMNSRESGVPQGLFAIEFLLAPDPLPQVPSHHDELTAENLRGVLDRLRQPISLTYGDSSGISGTAPFQSAAFRDYSVILRQTTPDNPLGSSPELELTLNGAARIRVPLEPIGDLETRNLDSLASVHARRALKTVKDFGLARYSSLTLTRLQLYDVDTAFVAAAMLVSFYLEWAAADLWSGRVRVAHRLITEYGADVWPIVFSDCDEWGKYSIEYGLPTVERRDYFVPEPNWNQVMLNGSGALWASCLLDAAWSLGVGDVLPGILTASIMRMARITPDEGPAAGDV